MKRLVIHPDDRSTDFLRPIYAGLDATVVTGGVSGLEVKEMIREHDQIIMLGHGTSLGLMSVGQFDVSWRNIIDDTVAPLLAKKDNSVFIWCNADLFVKYNKLRGFFTGMFVSDIGEARFCGMPLAQQHMVDESNTKFADIVGEAANDELPKLYKSVMDTYGELARINPIASYNHQRLYAA